MAFILCSVRLTDVMFYLKVEASAEKAVNRLACPFTIIIGPTSECHLPYTMLNCLGLARWSDMIICLHVYTSPDIGKKRPTLSSNGRFTKT